MKIPPENWKVEKIAVVGPGIVGMPMAAMLANARICINTDVPAKVVVIQRNSPTSGWKVAAINSGRSVIGGIEPELDRIVAESVAGKLLYASHDYRELQDADVILVCVQTDKKVMEPDYGPLLEALDHMAKAIRNKPQNKKPLIIFESTLAPSSVATVIKEQLGKYGLLEGQDFILGNSPNRVMPGRLVERVARSDKLIGGLRHETTAMIKELYGQIVKEASLYTTNSLTAEVVKTFENAYRDIRIAFAAELVRYCDENDIDFYKVRELVNERLLMSDRASFDGGAVPSGGILIPTIGVGGHCLPKDGILLAWRKFEHFGVDPYSLILEARKINDESPSQTIKLAERHFGSLRGKSIALMGAAYRFNSEDTRNSPSLSLAKLLLEMDCNVTIHDPYVKADDQKLKICNLSPYFFKDIGQAILNAEYIIYCTAHKDYKNDYANHLNLAPKLKGIVDGCNLLESYEIAELQTPYAGIGKGKKQPAAEFIETVYKSFRIMERGTANELFEIIRYLNENYAGDEFNRIDFNDVQRIAGTCVTGCTIVDPGAVESAPSYKGFVSRLVKCAKQAWDKNNCGKKYLDIVASL